MFTIAAEQLEAFQRIKEYTGAVAIRVQELETPDIASRLPAGAPESLYRPFTPEKASHLRVHVYTHEGGWGRDFTVRPTGTWGDTEDGRWRDWRPS